MNDILIYHTNLLPIFYICKMGITLVYVVVIIHISQQCELSVTTHAIYLVFAELVFSGVKSLSRIILSHTHTHYTP